MSTSIDTVTIVTEDRRLVLQNSQVARVINIGTSWSTLRIGVRWSMDDTGFSIGGTPRLYMGMMSGPTAGMANGPLTDLTSHFVGFVSTTGIMTRTAGPYYSVTDTSSSSSNIYAKKVGSTLTLGSGTGIAISGVQAAPSSKRSAFIVEIVKGAPNFTINICRPNAAPVNDIATSNVLKQAMEATLMTDAATILATATGGTYGGTPTGTVAVSEGTNGYLDAICVAWDRSSPALHISDIMWAKKA